jgi:CxxC-x17-CxxC domain-containing protein
MIYTEKPLACSDCGIPFPFTAEEQQLFAVKGYTNEPKRCPACRSSRRTERYVENGGSSIKGSSQMYPATCGRCGKQTEVPFQPSANRPVYCRDCFIKSR